MQRIELKPKKNVLSSLHSALLEALSYRLRRPVTHIRVLQNGDYYSICPRCNGSIEREYSSYCDQCGQHLTWLSPFAKTYSRNQK